MKLVHLFFFVIIFYSHLAAQSQKIRFQKLTVEDGLSDNRVLSIIQDKRGFMWFGTLYGLNRYDGYTIKQYLHDPEDSLSIASGWITQLYEDQAGTLWIGTWGGGLCRYDRERDRFIRYTKNKDDPSSLCGNGINRIFESDKNILWIATNFGLNRYNPESDNFSRYYPDENIKTFEDNINFVGTIAQDRNGTLWIGTWNQGLFYHDAKNDTFVKFKVHPNFVKIFINQFPFDLLATSHHGQNFLWYGSSYNGFYKINLQDSTIHHYKHQPRNRNSLSNNRIRKFYFDQDKGNELWIATENGGLNRFDIPNEAFTHYRHQPGNEHSLSYDEIYTLYGDRSGFIWIGTPMGLNVFDPGRLPFHALHFPGEIVSSIFQSGTSKDSSLLWLGTDNGLLSYDLSSRHYIRFRHDPENINSISDNVITDIVTQGTSGEQPFYVATMNGLNRINPHNMHVIRYFIPENDPVFNQIYTLCPDKNGRIWLGTQSSYLIHFDIITERFVKHGSHYGVIRSLHMDESGTLWIGTQGNGLFALNPQTGHEKQYTYSTKNKKSITGSSVRAILRDREGILWVGTDKGLNKFNHSDSTFSHITNKDGLISNLVRAIRPDKKGNLWLSTDLGISKYNPGTRQIRNFTVDDGLHNNEFWLSSHIGVQSELYFGGKDGLTWFQPDSIKNNTLMPSVYLTDFQIFNRSIMIAEDSPLKQNISEVKEIVLTHDQSVFSLEFAALEHIFPQKISYAYNMENVDPDWVHTDYKRRFVTYTNLDPGDYIFQVKNTNKNGEWNKQPASIKITILPPWWATWWSYLVYIVFILGLAYALRRYELNRLHLKHDLQLKETEARQLQEMDCLRSKFFANISHEFRTPLTLILGPLQRFIDKSQNDEDIKQYSLMQRNALRLHKLINQLLDLSRLEAGKLTLAARNTDIVQLTRNITAAFESHAQQRNIRLLFETDLKKQDIFLDTDKYEKIINNLLSNAFKFSEDGTTIKLSVVKEDASDPGYTEGSCIIKIGDQGMGIAPENLSRVFDRFYQVDSGASRGHEGSGIGLALAKELVELHHGTITVDSERDKGTVFTIQIPLGKEHLAEDEMLDIPADEIKVDNDMTPAGIKEQHLVESNEESVLPVILVVEDHPDVRSYIGGILEKEYHLLLAENGDQGIDQAIRYVPDLIISDVMMPGMDGFELCDKIKNDTRTSHIPVILLTARAGQQNKLEGLDTGADDYLTKPFDARELLARIHNLIEQRHRLQEKFSRQNPFNPQQLDFSENDRSFLGQAVEIINKNISNPSFNTALFAEEIALSRTQLFRKLKSLTGQSVSDFVRHIRLNRAAELLKNDQGNVSEVAFQAGFNHLSHFARYFKNQFGITPSEYTKKHKSVASGIKSR